MEKLLLTVLLLTSACLAQFIGNGGFSGRGRGFDGRGFGGHGRGYFEPFFSRRGSSFGDQNSLFAADRFGDRSRANEDYRDNNRFAAAQTNKDNFAHHNTKAGENFYNAKNQEVLSANHDISKNKNFKLQVVDQNAHDEHSDVNFKRGNAASAGNRFKSDQGVEAARFDDQHVKAASDKDQGRAFAQDVEADKNFENGSDNFFAEKEEFGN